MVDSSMRAALFFATLFRKLSREKFNNFERSATISILTLVHLCTE